MSDERALISYRATLRPEISCTSSTMSAITKRRWTSAPRFSTNPPSSHRISRITMIVQSIRGYLLPLVFGTKKARKHRATGIRSPDRQKRKDAPARGVLLLRSDRLGGGYA